MHRCSSVQFAKCSIFISIIQIDLMKLFFTFCGCLEKNVPIAVWEIKKLSERQREEKKHKYEKKQLIYRSHGRVVLPSQNPIQSNCVEMLICLHCKMSAYFDSFPSFCQSKNLYKVNWQEKLNYLTLSWLKLPFLKFCIMWVGSRIHIDFVDHKKVGVTVLWIGVAISTHTQHTHSPIIM